MTECALHGDDIATRSDEVQLAGATLDELLNAAEDDCWPNNQCEAEWELLRNWAIQTESVMVDEVENAEWSARMRGLAERRLPYLEWVEARGEALKDRMRARKLAQANLRYRYGYRGKRRWGLLRIAVRELYRASTAEHTGDHLMAS